MKTRLEYHIRKFKKKYQFEQYRSGDPLFGKISIDGWVFSVKLDLRKPGKRVRSPYCSLSIAPRSRVIYIPRVNMLEKQCYLYSALYHEIGHFVLYRMGYSMDHDMLEACCDLFSIMHTGMKNQKKSRRYILNHRRLNLELTKIYATKKCFDEGVVSFYDPFGGIRAREVKIYTKRRNRTYVKKVIKASSSVVNVTVVGDFLLDFRNHRRWRMVEKLYKESIDDCRNPIWNNLKNAIQKLL